MKVDCPEIEIDNLWIASLPKQVRGNEGAVATAALLSNAFEYDDDGKIVSINKIELFSTGFVIGAIVNNSGGSIFKIEQVDTDGTIFIRPSKNDGGYETNL